MKKMLARLAMIGVVGMTMQAQAALVAYWDFNEGSGTVLHDRSGNGNDGTINGAVWSPGVAGSSLYFDGVAASVRIANVSPFMLSNLTVACWVKPGNFSYSNYYEFFNNLEAYSGTAHGFTLRINPNSYLTLSVGRADISASWVSLSAAVTFSPGYHFLAGTYNGTQLTIYFDGTQVGQIPYSGGISYGNVYPYIGASPSNQGHPDYFLGNIDEMRIYNSALSDAEIKTLYTNNPHILPLLLYPVPSPSYNRRPVLSWHAIKDAGAYTVQIDTVNNFAHPIYSVPLPDTVFPVLLDLPIDTIYWQVIAGVNDTLMYYSTVGSFIIQDPLVPIPIPYEPKVTLERQPVLTWHAVAGASSYTFEVAQTSTFTNPIFLIPVSDTGDTIATNLPYGQIFWRVKSNLSAAWSTFDMFQIVPDSIPALVRFNGAQVSTKTPLFKWHPVAGATSYKIEIADNRAFTGVGGYSVPTSDTVFLPAVGLSNGMWYWHVSCSRNSALFSPMDSVMIAATGVHEADMSSAAGTRPFVVAYTGRKISIVSTRGCEGNFQAALYDMQGNRLRKAGITGGKIVMDMPELSCGLYLLEIKNSSTSIRSKVIFR